MYTPPALGWLTGAPELGQSENLVRLVALMPSYPVGGNGLAAA